MKAKKLKAMLASRTGLYKSYIKNIQVCDTRVCTGHVHSWVERDYSFDYKGKKYVCEEHIVPNSKGEVIYSAKTAYTLREV